VLHATGIPYKISRDAGGFEVLVASGDVERSRVELDAYASENRDRLTIHYATATPARGWGGVLAFGTVLVIVAIFQHRHSFGVAWLEAGKTHTGLIRQGEWWRAVTALTLHADLAHLLANVVIGGMVGLFAAQSLGSGLGWLLILIGGASGNLLNAWLHQAEHTSVGASTAVFAALGLQAALAWRRRQRLSTLRMERWVPLVGAVVLLSFLGTGGERTDVAAHVLGFVSGAVLGGLVGARVAGGWSRPGGQIIFGVATLAILVGAWAVAVIT